MVNESIQFLLQYVFTSFACYVLYFIGIILLRLFPLVIDVKKSKWLYNYSAIVLGIVTTVVIYSIILAKGKTINLLFIPIFLGLFFTKRKRLILFDWKNLSNIFPVIFLTAIPFLFVLLFHLFPESEYKQNDALHYLQISQSLNDLGQENNFGALGLFEKHNAGTVPYHYFEFWLNAILIKIFSGLIPNIDILRFVCYGIICIGGLLGLFALAEHITKTPLTFVQMVFCTCFIFYIPNFLGYISFLKPIFVFPYENNMLERPNLRTLYLFLPGILITIGNERYKWQSIFWIIGTIVTSLLNFFVLLVVIPVFCFIAMRNLTTRKYAIFIISCFFFTAMFYFLFYYLTSSNTKVTPIGTTKEGVIAYCIRYWKFILFSSVSSVFYCLCIPMVLLAFIKKSNKNLFAVILKRHQVLILFACIIVFAAVIIARALNFMDDSYQFAFLGYTMGSILFFVLFLSISKLLEIKIWVYYLTCIFFLASFLTMRFFFHPEKYKNVFKQNGSYTYGGKNYTEVYIKNILTVFPSDSKVIGGFWVDSIFYDTIHYYSSRNPNLYSLPSRYLLASKLQFNYEVCMSDSSSIMYGFDTSQKASYNYLRSAITRSVFYLYQTSGNLNQKRLSYIKKYKLRYLILTKNADISIINQLPILQFFQDSNTGERFYIIDTNRL